MKHVNRHAFRGQERRFLPACMRHPVGWLLKAPQATFSQ